MSAQNIGANVTLRYERDGKPGTVAVTLGELPDEDARQPEASGKIGMALQTLSPDVADSLGMDRATKGAVITDVIQGSAAERAGLKPGDVIVEVDRRTSAPPMRRSRPCARRRRTDTSCGCAARQGPASSR